MNRVIAKMRESSIKVKFRILFGIILNGILLVGLLNTVTSNRLLSNMNDIYHNDVNAIFQVENMRSSFDTVASVVELMYENRNEQAISWHWDDYELHIAKFEKFQAELEQLNRKPEEITQLHQLSTHLTEYKQVAEQVKELALNEDYDGAAELYSASGVSLHKDIMAQLESLRAGVANYIEQVFQEQGSIKTRDFTINMIVLVLISVLSAICIFQIRNSIEGPVSKLQNWMAKAAAGDLRVKSDIQGNNEMGHLSQSFNEMISGLRELVARIQVGTNQIIEGASEVARNTSQSMLCAEQTVQTMNYVGEQVNMQRNTMHETTIAMEEMSRGIQDIVDSTGLASDFTTEASEHTGYGATQMKLALEQMSRIRTAVENSVHLIVEMNNRSASVQKVVNAIKDISRQTNLLSLNASIEAARAGEHGRGFSVVAEEVRKLSEESNRSLRAIEQTMAGIQDDMQNVYEAMVHVQLDVNKGEETLQYAGQTFMEINDQVQQAAGMMQNISAATEEMSAGSEQVAASTVEVANIADQSMAAANKVDAMTREQLNSIQEVLKTMDNLCMLAIDLETLVNQFEMGGEPSEGNIKAQSDDK